MKKLLAYIFLVCSTLPIFVNAEMMEVGDTGTGYTFYGSDILKLEKPGFYNLEGVLVNDQSDISKDHPTYYKTDGKILYEYSVGKDGVASIVDSLGKPNDDRVVKAYYLLSNSNNTAKVVQSIDVPAGISSSQFEFDIAKRFGFLGSATNAEEYQKQFNTRTNQASFGKDTSTGDDATKYSNLTDKAREMEAHIKSLQKDLAELNKDPEKNAGEIAVLEEAIKEAQDGLKNINEERRPIGNAVSTNFQQGVVKDAIKNAPKVSFAGIDLCGQWATQWIPGVDDVEFKACAAAVANLGIEVVSIPFTYAASLLDITVTETVVKFGAYFKNGGPLYTPVNNIWTLVKSICNLFFIAALIFIALKTIWDADGFQEKKTLVRVIIFAVLINFSMYFTRLLIDVSNTAALQVFNVLAQTNAVKENSEGAKQLGQTTIAKAVGAEIAPNSLANVFLSNMQIQRFIEGSSSIGGQAFKELDVGYIFSYGLMSIIFILVSTVVIGVIAGMLIIRFVILVVLMMTSPIAYIGSFTPGPIASYSKMWWEKFKGNLIFLPVLMVMFYITMVFAQFVRDSIGTGSYTTMILGYIMTIAMLIISISVAQSAGGSAGVASWGSKWAKGIVGGATFGLAARAGRRTVGLVGFGADKFGVSKGLKNLAYSNSRLARFTGASALARQTLKAGSAVNNASFDARNIDPVKGLLGGGLKGGYAEIKKEQEKAHKEALDAYKKNMELSDSEKFRKLQAEAVVNVAKANEAVTNSENNKKAAESEVEKLTNSLGSLDQHIATTEAKIESEKVKVEAEIATKFSKEESEYKEQIETYEKLANEAAKTPDERLEMRKKAAENRSALNDLGNKKAKEIESEVSRRMGTELKSLDDTRKQKEQIEKQKVAVMESVKDIDEKIKKSIENRESIIKELSKKGFDILDKEGKVDKAKVDKLISKSGKYAKDLGKLKSRESELSKEYQDYLASNMSMGNRIFGAINGRNKVIRETILKTAKESKKSEAQKIVEQMVKDQIKAENADSEKK